MLTIRRLLIAVLAGCFTSVGFAALEFTGYMRSKDAVQFIVTDLDSGATSGWLKIGSAFADHKITAFEDREEVLVLEHDGQGIRLALKDAHVRDGKPALAEKAEVHLRVSPDGVLVLDEQPISFDAFESLLRKSVESRTPIALFFHGPWSPAAKVQETMEMVWRAIPKSGAKKFSLTIVNAPPPKK